MALKLEPARGEAILRSALAVPPTDHASLAIRSQLVLIAAKTFWTTPELRQELLDELVFEHDNPRDGRIVFELGRALAARDGIPTADLLRRAQALASGHLTGDPSILSNSLWIVCVALLQRDRAAFTLTVKQLGAELTEHLGPEWEPLVSQCIAAVVRGHS